MTLTQFFIKQKINYETVKPRHTALPLAFMWDTTLPFSVLKFINLVEAINTLLLHLLLDCPENKFQCRQGFLPDQARGPPSLLYNGYQVIPMGKAVDAPCQPTTPI